MNKSAAVLASHRYNGVYSITPEPPLPTSLLQSDLPGLEELANSSRQGARCLCLAGQSPADRRQRPPLGLRRGAARSIPGKGEVLTEMSNFWLLAAQLIANHLPDTPLAEVLPAARTSRSTAGTEVARRLKPVPVEAIVAAISWGRAEGLPGRPARCAASACPRACGGRPPAGAAVHAVHQGRGRPSRRECELRGQGGRPSAPISPRGCARPRSPSITGRRLCR